MHQHLPRKFSGPVRGSPAWWRALELQNAARIDSGQVDANQVDASQDEEKPKKSRKKPAPQENDPQIRQELVDRVRKEIEAGTYDTQEKWEAALDSLLDRLAKD
jgi:anti-sigma28 factor (negative regulator of flagellin synthesis)